MSLLHRQQTRSNTQNKEIQTPAGDKIEAPPAKTTKGKKENKSKETPTVSPDQGTTGETAVFK